jgi:hypothetical protein
MADFPSPSIRAGSVTSFKHFGCVLLGFAIIHCGTTTSSLEVSPPPLEARLSSEILDPLDSFVEMGAPDTLEHIVSGIERDEKTGQWRAQSGATLRFLTLPLDEIRFGRSFNLPPGLIAKAKLAVLRISHNGQPFIEQTFNTAGPHSVDEAVPKGLVTWQHETQVGITVESASSRPLEQPLLQFISVGFRP